MLWVLKRTVSMRRLFKAPKTYVKTDGHVNIYIKAENLCLPKLVLNHSHDWICSGLVAVYHNIIDILEPRPECPSKVT